MKRASCPEIFSAKSSLVNASTVLEVIVESMTAAGLPVSRCKIILSMKFWRDKKPLRPNFTIESISSLQRVFGKIS